MFAFWWLIVRPQWVRLTANAYADRFVAAIEKLYDERTT
jgi:hypothetical protein